MRRVLPGFFNSSSRGFSLTEMLLVLGIMGILLAFSTPGLMSLRSTGFSTTGREFGSFLNYCRSKAIADRNAVRIGVVFQSSDETRRFKSYAAWAWDKSIKQYRQITQWHQLPQDTVFETQEPNYLSSSLYAQKEPASIRGDFVLGNSVEGNTSEIEGPSGNKETIRYFTFSPSGRASLPHFEERNLIMILRMVGVPESGAQNWFQYSIDTLTGRTRIYRP